MTLLSPLRACVAAALILLPFSALAQERLPWERAEPAPAPADDGRPSGRYDWGSRYGADDARVPPANQPDDGYAASPPPRAAPYPQDRAANRAPGEYGYERAPPRRASPEPYERDYGSPPPRRADNYNDYGRSEAPDRYDQTDRPPYRSRDDGRPREYSRNEIVDAGHKFFGSVSKGLGQAIEYAFKQSGRPNGYILGEDAGGAFVAGLRYGEGTLYTKDAGSHRVYWQGPTLGYDFGGEGSRVMVLVYNLRHPSQIYHRFGGVQGSAYLVGGVSVQFQKHDDVVLAPIRAGVGLRLGANIGYLKYTRRPTWNPF